MLIEKPLKPEEVLEQIAEIAEFCKCWYDKTNVQEMSERLTNLNVNLAKSADLLVRAQEIYHNGIAVETEKLLNSDISPSVLNNLVKGRVATYNKLYTLCERVNKTITHQIEAIRTQISLQKALTNI